MKYLIPLLTGFLICLTITLDAQPAIQQGMLYVKLNAAEKDQKSQSFDLWTIPSITDIEPVKKTNSNQRSGPSILDGLYKIYVKPNISITELCEELNLKKGIQYAEPIYMDQLLYNPNDPELAKGNQSYLEIILAQEAWDVTKGSENIIIGISDSGLDLNNPDIADNLYTNENDPVNNIDDDGNGYVDDYHGYDFGEGDNDPSPEEGRKHGTMVGGLAGAAADNEFGIAGVAFNVSLGALKVHSVENAIINGYESIIYAADNGYDIINLSWGSPNSFSQAAQDIITYAAVERGLIIVAAAGNTPADLKFYPASYEHVISVAASNPQDNKAGFSTYSYSVDMLAPGEGIFSLALNNGYATDNGTSYSAPLVAGAAALVKSVFPDFHGLQVAEQLRVTSDNIYNTGSNSSYNEQLGYGRLNVYRAVTEDSAKSLRLQRVSYSNPYASGIYPGDTISVTMDAINYLFKTENMLLNFSSESPYLELLEESLAIGALGELDTFHIDIPLFVVSTETPPETLLSIRVGITDGEYSDYQYLEFQSSSDRIDLNNQVVELTVSGRGNLGYDRDSFFDGIGLRSNTTIQANRMGILISEDADHVSDNLPKSPLSNDKSKDFKQEKAIRYDYSPMVDLRITSTFNDDSAANPIGIDVEQSFLTNESENFLIQEYRLMNGSSQPHNLNLGYYIDWALATNARQNKAFFDNASKTVLAVNEDSSRFAAVKSYFDHHPAVQLLDLETNNQNEPDIADLTENTKYQLGRSSLLDVAGKNGPGNNIAVLITHDSIDIAPTYGKKAAFMIAFGSSLAEVTSNITKAETLYTRYLNQPDLLGSFLGCNGANLKVQPDSATYRYYSDPLGQNFISQGKTLTAGPITSDTVFYAARMVDDLEQKIQRIDINLVENVADFTMSTDTLYLDDVINTVQFTDQSFEPISWSWNFDNGVMASVQNPNVYFSEPGTYEISLHTVSATGCTGTITKSLVIAERPPKPIIENIELCYGASVQIQSSDLDSLALYRHEDAPTAFSEGTSIMVGPITSDTTLYFSNINGPYESLKTRVMITINRPVAQFYYFPDTTSVESIALFVNQSDDYTSRWYVNGTFAAQNDTLSLEVNQNSYDIALSVNSAIGCRDSLQRTIQFKKSPTPRLNFEQPCAGDDLLLEPNNGSIFGFYQDINLENLIHKGKSLKLEQVGESAQVYIVGLDSLLPSDHILAEITPNQLLFQIQAEPDTLYIDEGLTSTFSSIGALLSRYRWYINGQFIESVASPKLVLDSIGVYEVVLYGIGPSGCNNTDTLTYHVLKTRPKMVLSAPNSGAFLYPNPAKTRVHIKVANKGSLKIADLTGRVLIEKELDKSGWIDLSKLTPATYILTYTTHREKLQEQLIIR